MFRVIKNIIIFLWAVFCSSVFSQTHWETVVNRDAEWRYLTSTDSTPKNWQLKEYDDSRWRVGRGGFGYGDEDDLTVVKKCRSLYLRKKINLADKEMFHKLILDVDFDDAFIFYLNGNEVWRSRNVTDSVVLFDSDLKYSHEAFMYRGILPIRQRIDTSFLLNGINTLAVQVLNSSISSEDLTAIIYLHAQVEGDIIHYDIADSIFKIPELLVRSNLPILKVEHEETSIPFRGKIRGKLLVINNPEGINGVLDKSFSHQGFIGIGIRGSTSAMFPKKSYSIETRNEKGGNDDVFLLNLPADNDWILLAPYSDKSLIRNALAFHLGEQLSQWAPRTKFCELVVNDDYQGVYMLTEKIKSGRNRVDISNMDTRDVDYFDVTGGYIIKLDNVDLDEEYWSSDYKGVLGTGDINFIYVEPSSSEILSVQKDYIKSFVGEFESNLHKGNSTYTKHIDILSFVDYFLVSEISRNVDAYRKSAFLFKQNITDDDKLYMGPIWDFNLAFGNVNFNNCYETSGWAYQSIPSKELHQVPFWWEKFRGNEHFNTILKNRWDQLRKESFKEEIIFNYIDSLANVLEEPARRNFSHYDVLNRYVWPNYFIGKTYEEEIRYLKDWIHNRLIWMDIELSMIEETDDKINEYVLKTFPNPFNEKISFDLILFQKKVVQIDLYNTAGKKIFGKSWSCESGQNLMQINKSELKERGGVYIYTLYFEGEFIEKGKIINQ